MEQEITYEVENSEAVESSEAVEQAPEVEETPEVQEEPAAPQETEAERKERIEFSDEQQRYINEHIVARQVAKRKEVERELEQLRQQAPQQQEDPTQRPMIPDPPNIWEENYEEKVQARDEAIRHAAAWEAAEQQRQQYEAHQQQLQAQQQQQALMERVTTYTSRAQEYGIADQDLQTAGNAVGQYGMPNELVDYILEDDAGPAITVHLSRNLQELDELNRMDPIRAAVYIATEIKPKAVRNAKRRSPPPEPVESPKGAGVPEQQRGPKGAVYE